MSLFHIDNVSLGRHSARGVGGVFTCPVCVDSVIVEVFLASIKSSQKRARQSAARRKQNVSQRSAMRTFIKKVKVAVQARDHEAALTAWQRAQPVLDRFATKGLLHKNKAARHKSRLMKAIVALSSG